MNTSSLHNTVYDTVIIGAGVVGCALTRYFVLQGHQVLLVEKAPDILDGASKGNSAILHTGFDAPPQSLEQRCVSEGYTEYLAIHKQLGLPLIQTGALVVAWNEKEAALLPALMAQAKVNGISDTILLSKAETLALEPHLAPHLHASFCVPRESVIDPWSAPHAYLMQAMKHGAQLLRECEVLSGLFNAPYWQLQTTQGHIKARSVINAAGLYGDVLNQRLIQRSLFSIKPRKGQFVVYDKLAAKLVSHIILPVPNDMTKGIVVCRTAFGNVLVGPTAQEQEVRDKADVVTEDLQQLRQCGERILPALSQQSIIANYAGLRPATEYKDYQIDAINEQCYVSVGGIRSTGLSAALGIAKYVFSLCETFIEPREPIVAEKRQWPQSPVLAETGFDDQRVRDWQCEGNQGMVCHCESVTQREIQQALSDALSPNSFAGLKRRTRVTMGRCQGFYCTQRLHEITQGRLRYPVVSNAVAARAEPAISLSPQGGIQADCDKNSNE